MKTYTGINIQYPISQLILDGTKTIETRTYPIPANYIGRDMLLVETPGPTGKFKARIVAVVRFKSCHRYSSADEFYKDKNKHMVTPDSPWAWQPAKGKWGWTIDMIKPLIKPREIRKRIGIKYTKHLKI